MQYISTRGQAPALDFEQTMLAGLARDGGLYVPRTVPALSPDDFRALRGASYEEAAFAVMRPFVGDCFTDDGLRAIILEMRLETAGSTEGLTFSGGRGLP